MIFIGERGSPHVEELDGIAVGFGDDAEPRVVVTLAALSGHQRQLLADRLERLLPHLRAGLVGACH
jgi:hypothetical protein